ncbi:hypothetical protein B0H66DRAFT_619172 [Apodospora peruviana]|uniref:Gylcosyl hydrolase 115 C-terminal domain-containing protein n=1 Tax=Apodospora peruviana TaxID=516989 RepID=A0AAE0IC02_9PEZI|nr:hypothetical protein B0H66DRAFT_619172 [Apodospora peruviana]
MKFARGTNTLLLFGLVGSCRALLEKRFVSFEPVASLNGTEQVDLANAVVIIDQEDFVGVSIAANSLAQDLAKITGQQSRDVRRINFSQKGKAASNKTQLRLETAIIAGSANSSLVRELVSNGVVDMSEIQGKWESFKTTVVAHPLAGIGRALVIIGSDKRGTIYGIHTLAEQSGQSPYHWFADVPTKKHDSIFAVPGTSVHGEPSIKYRGLFINDEEPALNTWWARCHNATRYPLDSEFYGHVFDLLLRLKANYLWPAMWKSFTPGPGNIFFTDDPKNQQLANDYGIVVSTAHHEPMQRATNEWDETQLGPWDWSKNKVNMTTFMEEGIERAGNNESYITVGLRGLGDEAANTQHAIPMLEDVFSVQREIIKKNYGSETAVNQVWALYKEVASYYDAGLDPPEDITLLFPDDNWGNVYRLPTGAEVDRKGGTGVYFHFEYVGLPRSYKWANTNSLAKVFKELNHAYLRGAKQIWIMNVGDIKPMELPLGFAMDMAWNATNFSFDRIPAYLKAYASREFGDEDADEIASILLEHSHLVGMRRYELVTPDTYSVLNYGEAERVVRRWQNVASRAKVLYARMDEQLKPAFFQLVYHPVVAGALYHTVTVGIGTNYRFALERRNSANAIASQVLADFEASYDLVEEWDAMLGGKWANMMSQAYFDAVEEPKRWAAPSRNIVANLSYVQLRENMQFSLGNLGIRAEGSPLNPTSQGRWAESVDASMPTTAFAPILSPMEPYGSPSRWVEVFMRGDHRVPIRWALDPIPVDWLTILPANGTLSRDTQTDQRLNVTLDWSRVPEGFNDTVLVGVTSTPAPYPYFEQIHIPVRNNRVPASAATRSTFPETDGMVSIESPHFQSSSSSHSSGVYFEAFPHLGSRSESGSIALRPFDAARTSAAKAAWVSYGVYLFSGVPLEATVYINGGLDTDPKLKMEFSLTLDDAPANFTRVLGDYIKHPNAGDIPPEWIDHVADNVWTKRVSLGHAKAGAHKLVWRVNSPEVYMEKIVLHVRGTVRPSYLGPPETYRFPSA